MVLYKTALERERLFRFQLTDATVQAIQQRCTILTYVQPVSSLVNNTNAQALGFVWHFVADGTCRVGPPSSDLLAGGV